jgi:hypothetical protein
MKRVATVLAIAVALAGCGDDETGDDDDGALADAAPATIDATAGAPDAGACLEVVATAPEDGAVDVALDAQIAVQFNYDVDDATLPGMIAIRDMDGDVGADFILSANDVTILSIEITAPELGTEYTVIVNGGEDGVRAVNGCWLAGDYTFSFTTVSS